jgi:hypothetical protein
VAEYPSAHLDVDKNIYMHTPYNDRRTWDEANISAAYPILVFI